LTNSLFVDGTVSSFGRGRETVREGEKERETYIWLCLHGGEEPYDALSCRSFFAKEPLIIGLLCGKWPKKIRHPMGPCYPVHTGLGIRFTRVACSCI